LLYEKKFTIEGARNQLKSTHEDNDQIEDVVKK